MGIKIMEECKPRILLEEKHKDVMESEEFRGLIVFGKSRVLGGIGRSYIRQRPFGYLKIHLAGTAVMLLPPDFVLEAPGYLCTTS